LQQLLQKVFFEISLQIGYISLQSWSKNAKLDGKIFLLNVSGFCREKDSKNSGQGGQHLDHLVQPVQLFLDQGLLIKGQLFSPNPRFGVGFCREK
jgi:hypothetical protein